MSGKDLEGRIRDLLGDKKEIEIRKGLSICKPSKELDLLQIREGSMNYYLSLCDPDILGEVIDYVYTKKPEEEEGNVFPDEYPDDLPNDSPFKKKKKDLGEDPLKDNIFIPDPDNLDGKKKKKKEPDPIHDNNPFLPDFD